MNGWAVIYEGAACETFDYEHEALARREDLVAEAIADDPDFDPAAYEVGEVCLHGWPVGYCQDGCDGEEDS